jgi:hypothetical protein
MDDPLRKFHIRSCVLDALSRHGIAHDSPLRAQLEANATIAAGNDSRVIMKNGNSVDVEIQNRLNSPSMNERLPTTSRTVAKSDTDSLLENFEDIAAGKVRVQ